MAYADGDPDVEATGTAPLCIAECGEGGVLRITGAVTKVAQMTRCLDTVTRIAGERGVIKGNRNREQWTTHCRVLEGPRRGVSVIIHGSKQTRTFMVLR